MARMEINMNQPVRVLHVLGGLSLGGAESRIMDLYHCMDKSQVQFDFLLHQNGMARIPEFYDEEVKSLGGKIYILPKFKVYNYFQYKKAVREFFKEHHEFAVVQGHMTSTASIYLREARKAGFRCWQPTHEVREWIKESREVSRNCSVFLF